MARSHQVAPVDHAAAAIKAGWDWNALLRNSLPPSSTDIIFKHSTGIVSSTASSKEEKNPSTTASKTLGQQKSKATSMFKLPKTPSKPPVSLVNGTARGEPSPSIQVDESSHLPNRLMDFFCVVGAATNNDNATTKTTACTSDNTEPFLILEPKQKLESTTSPTQVKLKTKVMDCYPEPDSYEGIEFPHHIHKFLFPNGCRVAETTTPASLMTFVLTLSNGNRMYGASLKMYEDVGVTRSDLANAILPDPLPSWTNPQYHDSQSTLLVPKCLVVLSHHALFDVLRKFLQQLYRIYKSPRGSPLPLERYIANMMHDVPLPPPGRTRIHYDNCFFTKDTSLRIERPAPNQLPLVNVSYRPLFSVLSLTNVLTVWGVLLQEGRVVLCSKYWALLTPVAEALLSLLYPLVWEGIYVPVLPSDMIDVLDAPIPFLVGMDSRLLDLDAKRRPIGVVLVDLDDDVVHLGWDDTCGEHPWIPRAMPDIPYAAVMRLKVQLEGLADHLYLVPPCGIKGRIMTGDGEVLDNAKRETYGQVTRVEMQQGDDNHRHFILSNAERAFVDETHEELNDDDFLVTRTEALTRESSISSHSPSPIIANAHGVVSTHASVTSSMKVQSRAVQAHVDRLMSLVGGREYATPSGAVSLNEKELLQKRFELATYFYDVEFNDGGNRIKNEEKAEERSAGSFGFDVRWSFIQFLTTILLRYRIFLKPDSGGSVTFQKEVFLQDLKISKSNQLFMAKVLESQMFDKFLRDRTDTAQTNHPQVILFDEFLVARHNQNSRGWGSRAKVETPFMEDRQWRVREVITPAAPYAIGVIWGSSYKYDTFPKLRANDFVANSSGSSLVSLCDAGSTLLCGSVSLACWDYDNQTCIQT